MVARTEFESEAGKNMLLRKDLYALKSSGKLFRALLVKTLDAMGYQLSYAKPYL